MAEKNNKLQMIFQPEHTEYISYVYLVNQIFESISDLFAK